jgi:hypothetical protein
MESYVTIKNEEGLYVAVKHSPDLTLTVGKTESQNIVYNLLPLGAMAGALWPAAWSGIQRELFSLCMVEKVT